MAYLVMAITFLLPETLSLLFLKVLRTDRDMRLQGLRQFNGRSFAADAFQADTHVEAAAHAPAETEYSVGKAHARSSSGCQTLVLPACINSDAALNKLGPLLTTVPNIIVYISSAGAALGLASTTPT